MKDSLLQLFPMDRRGFWQQVAACEAQIQEIRLRVKRPLLVSRNGQEWFLDERGLFTDKREHAYHASGQEIEELLKHICHYSLYAFEDELRQGFITVAGGHRVGIAGQVVLEGDGSVRTIKHIQYMNIRVAHQIKGAADGVLPLLYREGKLQNVLIISPPGCGKTTLLRDMVRQISDGNAYAGGMNVGLVDERSELAGSYLGQPQNDVGIRTDVLDACPKALGMMLLLRSMSPQVIAIDELGGREDMQALLTAASCGSSILATIHGDSLPDVGNKCRGYGLLEEQIFDCIILLGKEGGCPVIKKVYGKEEAYAAFAGRNYDGQRMLFNGGMVPGAIYGKT